MKELTAAQGLLRCGECDTIFDAMKALSTTLPEERPAPHPDQQTDVPTIAGKPADTRIRVLPDNGVGTKRRFGSASAANQGHKSVASRSRKFLLLSLSALAILLLLQLLYTTLNNPNSWLMENPTTAKLSGNICRVLGCEVRTPKDTSQIRVLSRSVYSHPNTPEVLIISSSIQNDAGFEQPFPRLEIRFLNNQSEVVAMRRFAPKEYMGNNKAEQLMKKGVPEEFSVNITDPGNEAVHFQFSFL